MCAGPIGLHLVCVPAVVFGYCPNERAELISNGDEYIVKKIHYQCLTDVITYILQMFNRLHSIRTGQAVNISVEHRYITIWISFLRTLVTIALSHNEQSIVTSLPER